MGTCCYTPRKTHFLWWYWLVLVSVIGLPMFLAAWYLHRKRRDGAGDFDLAVRKAEWIFYGTAVLNVLALMFVARPLCAEFGARMFSQGYHYNPIEYKYATTLELIGYDWVVCVFLAYWALKVKDSASDIVMLSFRILGFAGIWVLLSGMSLFINPLHIFFCIIYMGYGIFGYLIDYDDIVTIILKFICCLIPMAAWHRFIYSPRPRTAWLAVGGLVLGAILFYLSARYGNLIHFHLHELARGGWPNPADAAPYRMK